jgi:hypothetical protein
MVEQTVASTPTAPWQFMLVGGLEIPVFLTDHLDKGSSHGPRGR